MNKSIVSFAKTFRYTLTAISILLVLFILLLLFVPTNADLISPRGDEILGSIVGWMVAGIFAFELLSWTNKLKRDQKKLEAALSTKETEADLQKKIIGTANASMFIGTLAAIMNVRVLVFVLRGVVFLNQIQYFSLVIALACQIGLLVLGWRIYNKPTVARLPLLRQLVVYTAMLSVVSVLAGGFPVLVIALCIYAAYVVKVIEKAVAVSPVAIKE